MLWDNCYGGNCYGVNTKGQMLHYNCYGGNCYMNYETIAMGKIALAVIKDSFFMKPLDNLNSMNHHWPKIFSKIWLLLSQAFFMYWYVGNKLLHVGTCPLYCDSQYEWQSCRNLEYQLKELSKSCIIEMIYIFCNTLQSFDISAFFQFCRYVRDKSLNEEA